MYTQYILVYTQYILHITQHTLYTLADRETVQLAFTSQHLILIILELLHCIVGVAAEGSGCLGPNLGLHRGHLAEASPLEQKGNQGRID